MSPGQQAYERVRAEQALERAWAELDADEQAAWNLGASLTPVGAVLRLVQDENRKER